MYTVHVSIRVKEEYISSFKKVTTENAKNSLQEDGVIRFDILQEQHNPCEFMLVEIYRTPDDQQSHRQTEHFKKWKESIAGMLSSQYIIKQYDTVYPIQ